MKAEPVETAEAPAAFDFRRDGVTSDSNPSISELISNLRTAFRTSDFDRVEEILIAREEKLKREIKKKEQLYEKTRDRLGIERIQKTEAEEDLKSFKAKCAELEKERENIEVLRKRAETADERAKSAEERAKRSEDRYEKLLREVKKEESEKSSDIVELKKKNGELESAKTRAEEEVEIWKRRFVELEKRLSKLEADIEIISAENEGGDAKFVAGPTILITDSDDDCAPGASCSEKELSPRVLKRDRCPSVNVNEDEKDDDDDVVLDKRMRQDQELIVGGSSGNTNPATVTPTSVDPEKQNIPSNGQGVLGPSEANGEPEKRDFSYYLAKRLGDEVDDFKCGTTKDLWEAVRRSYHDVVDSSQVYEVIKKSFQLHQGGRPVAEYYNELNSIFMKLDYRRPNDMTYPADIEKQRKRIAEDRVYLFLAGLDHSLDQVSSRVLAASPLPNLEETFSMVRSEEQRQLTMGMADRSEASALAVQKNSSRPAPPFPSSKPSSRFCTHCNSTRHTEDVCWAKHGYPEWYKLKAS